MRAVSGVGEKSYIAGCGFLDRGRLRYFSVSVTYDFAANEFGELRKRFSNGRHFPLAGGAGALAVPPPVRLLYISMTLFVMSIAWSL